MGSSQDAKWAPSCIEEDDAAISNLASGCYVWILFQQGEEHWAIDHLVQKRVQETILSNFTWWITWNVELNESPLSSSKQENFLISEAFVTTEIFGWIWSMLTVVWLSETSTDSLITINDASLKGVEACDE